MTVSQKEIAYIWGFEEGGTTLAPGYSEFMIELVSGGVKGINIFENLCR